MSDEEKAIAGKIYERSVQRRQKSISGGVQGTRSARARQSKLLAEAKAVQDRMRTGMRMTKKDEDEDEDGHIKDGMRASGHLRGPKQSKIG